jgi:hypothetical protein
LKNSSNNLAITVELEILRQYRGKALWTALAVLFDGEGCIGLAHESSKGEKFNAALTVASTSIAWMEAWQARVERGNLYYYEGRLSTQKPTVFWKITKRADIVYILKKVQPFLIVKREQASLLVAFFEDKIGSNKTWLGEEERLRRRKIYDRMRELNKKGPSESVETKCQTSEVEDVIVPTVATPTEPSANDLVN